VSITPYLFIATLLFGTFSFTAAGGDSTAIYNDGPYLFNKEIDGLSRLKQIDIERNSLRVSNYQGGLGQVSHFVSAASDHYQDVAKIAAISDIHGQVAIFKQLLRNNGVIDNQLNWRWGTGHLVITGDIFDRGDTVTEALWLVFKLEQQAKAAGGKVHYLLGNHEYMVLRGDDRYIHDKYRHTLALMDTDLKGLFSNTTVLGQWLRSKSTVIKINDYVFMHGGIHQDFLDLNLTLEQANLRFRQSIGQSRKTLKEQAVTQVLYGRTGPIWYRGYFKPGELSDKDIDTILTQLGAKHIVVGHTSQSQLETRFGQRVIAIDSSIKNGVKGELLIIKANAQGGDELIRGTMNGAQSPLN